MSDRLPVILDVDTGIDDSVALALAVMSPGLDVVAVTTLSGNVNVGPATENTLRVLHAVGAAHVPVHRGASRPLSRFPVTAANWHGERGLGNANLPSSPATIGRDRGPAAIIRLALERPGEITLVCLGPLTNLAIALNVEPALVSLLRGVVIMGGAFKVRGNQTPYAEFNIAVDPEAAAQVFAAAWPLNQVVGLDVTRQVVLSRASWTAAAHAGSPAARLVHDVCGRVFVHHEQGFMNLHDPLTVLAVMQPGVLTFERAAVDVVLEGDRVGQTVMNGPGAVQVALGVDATLAQKLILEPLGVPILSD